MNVLPMINLYAPVCRDKTERKDDVQLGENGTHVQQVDGLGYVNGQRYSGSIRKAKIKLTL